MNNWALYLLENSDNKKTYLGVTVNINRRIRQHNGELVGGAKYTSSNKGDGNWILKAIVNNKKLPLNERFAAQLKLSKLPKNSAKIRIRNRCEITGRPHGVYRKLKISRIALRQMASAGKIPGMTKSSW